jgi:hypothetical protein
MRRNLLIASVAVLALAGAASAVVNGVSQRSLSQGTTFSVEGSDFVKPVRAWLDINGRRVPLRVLRGATEIAFTAQLVTFRRGLSGECQLAVKTKGSKIPSYFGGMAIELPVVDDITPEPVAAGATTTITGSYFGTKKPRVYVGDVKAKVTQWSDSSITIIVPPGLPAGDYFLDVESRAGVAPVRAVLTVAGN